MKFYPTKQHESAARKLVEMFSSDKRVMTILLTGSCARGKASLDSCLDVCIIVRNGSMIKRVTEKFESAYGRIREFKELRKAGKYSDVHLDVIDGKIRTKKREWTSGPDDYELNIGNIFIHTHVLFDREHYFFKLKKRYVPYYSECLRRKRLGEVKKYLYNNLDHIPLYVKRGLHFQSFSRLYNASREFLQALFIRNRVYPISYDKWIREQLVDILCKPEVYQDLLSLYEIRHFESDELIEKAEKLRAMAERFL